MAGASSELDVLAVRYINFLDFKAGWQNIERNLYLRVHVLKKRDFELSAYQVETAHAVAQSAIERLEALSKLKEEPEHKKRGNRGCRRGLVVFFNVSTKRLSQHQPRRELIRVTRTFALADGHFVESLAWLVPSYL